MSNLRKKPKEVAVELLTDPTKKIREVSHPLVVLWRRFLISERVTPSVWVHLVSKHILRKRAQKEMDAQAIGTERGNLSKKFIENDSMTFNVMLEGLRFLGSFCKIEIVIRGYKKDGTFIEHSTVVDEERQLFKAPSKSSDDEDGDEE